MGALNAKQCVPCQSMPCVYNNGKAIYPDREDIPEAPARIVGEATVVPDCQYGHTEPVFSIVPYAKNTRALTASGDGSLKIWDLKTYTVRYTLSGGVGAIVSCAVFGNDTRAVCGGGRSLTNFIISEFVLMLLPVLSGSTCIRHRKPHASASAFLCVGPCTCCMRCCYIFRNSHR
jgi:hypothetical protein